MRIYQAGPLFTAGEIGWHQQFKKKLEAEGHSVLWAGEFFTQEEIASFGRQASKIVMEKDRDAVDCCDAVVALLDGPQVDDGTAWEIGYAYAKGKPVIGIRTDFRLASDMPHGTVNVMIEASCDMYKTEQEVIDAVNALEAKLEEGRSPGM